MGFERILILLNWFVIMTSFTQMGLKYMIFKEPKYLIKLGLYTILAIAITYIVNKVLDMGE